MYKDLLAGCFAGSSGVLLGHPLDTLKTRVQLCHQPALGIANILGGILHKEGFLALYRGMAVPLVSAGFINSLLFSGYTITLRTMIGDGNGQRQARTTAEIIFASTVGTLCQLVPAIPIELIKTRLQTQKFTNKNCPKELQRQYSGPLNCAAKIVRQNGWLGLYQGGSAMFWRDIIGYFFYIPAYEHFRSALRRNVELNENICELLSGGLAGSLSWWIICPLELIKNRLQATENAANGLEKNKKLSKICRQIYAEGRPAEGGNWLKGIGGFYRGGSLLALRAFPVNACIFFVHSKCMQMF